MIPSTYAMKRSSDFSKTTPKDFARSSAIVVNSNLLKALLMPMLALYRGRDDSEIRFFYDEAAALQWLEQRKTIILRDRAIAPLSENIFKDFLVQKA
jgi:hypothetical protein